MPRHRLSFRVIKHSYTALISLLTRTRAVRILPFFSDHSGQNVRIPRRKEKMPRLDSAEKRLHDAISRLEKAVNSCVDSARADKELEADLRSRILELESEHNAMGNLMETAAVGLGATIEQLRGSLGE